MSLQSAKSRITKTKNSTETLINAVTKLLEDLTVQDTDVKSLQRKRNQIRQKIHRMKMSKKNLEDALEKLEQLYAELDSDTKGLETEAFLQYCESTIDAIVNIEEILGELSDREFEIEHEIDTHDTSNYNSQQTPNTCSHLRMAHMTLPPIQIPQFSGNSWEWENFWEIFNHNVHSQPIPAVMKFNYLLGSLSRGTKETVQTFQISEDGYNEAILWLKRKYGREDTIIEQLYAKLEKTKGEGKSTKFQRQLFDQVATTMSQLRNKGQDVNHIQLLNQISRKFEESIQDILISKKFDLPSTSLWTWDKLRDSVEDILSRKERIEEARNLVRGEQQTANEPQPTTTGITNTSQFCFYCKKSNHKPTDCYTVPIQERKSFFIRNKLCHNCARNNHTAAVCRSTGCRKCGRKHHTSLCESNMTSTHQTNFSNAENRRTQQLQPQTSNNRTTTQQRSSTQRNRQNTVQQTFVATEHETVSATSPKQEDTREILQVDGGQLARKSTRLLSGIAYVKGPQVTRQVHILLDTGSELSFIDRKLASDLKLKPTSSKTLRINTFGSNETKQDNYDEVTVAIQNDEGDSHEFKLFKSEVITKTKTQFHLQDEDWEFIKTNNFKVPHSENPSKPEILLGCDQLWEIMNGKMVKLPSGLYLVDTKFGYMVSGKQTAEEAKEPSTVTLTREEEKEQLDKFLILESSGLQEFTGTEKQEREETNRRVLENFNNTIIKRDDGYYVRLPWKENHITLPDNRCIAERRLKSIFETQGHNKTFIQAYDDTFQDQIRKGILEEALISRNKEGITHYLAHHAVITPKKTTTKMRIVFDASAHYKGKPSLNDVLHQGPLILPKIFGMIMRIRTGKIAIISDVEKAFLQVRLQEQDRDATRCLWVKNINNPPEGDNIVVYRFTRVTFGIKSSPFLLAATIKFHVDHDKVDQDMASDINNNLYVDNLFMTAESTEEAVRKYREAKTLFNKINMNLREFITNNEDVNDNINQEDKSREKNPSTLGITWSTANDNFVITHKPLQSQKITKRTVLRALASIYDPMGYLIPLTLKAKLFSQGLWAKEYAWDSRLSKEDTATWMKICTESNDFSKEIPRKIADKAKPHQLVVFTDASSNAMCTAIYLKNDTEQNLLVAKSRLPSTKCSHTVPKLELNAIAMGARLVNNTFAELKNQIMIQDIFILSDSEIALCWLKNGAKRKEGGVLVRNRYQEISEITENLHSEGIIVHFGYVNTKVNPADIGTRGMNSNELHNSVWWKGPTCTEWKKETHLFQIEDHCTVNLAKEDKMDTCLDEDRFHSFLKLKRVTAYLIRFLSNLTEVLPTRRKEEMTTCIPELRGKVYNGPLTGVEIRKATRLIIRTHQTQHQEEFQNQAYQKLNLKKDKKKITRCYGRLGKSNLTDETKYPAIIAPRTALARLVINEAHGDLHCSLTHTMSNVRQTYWIPSLREQVKKVIRRCVPCQRHNNLPYRYPNMEDLPERRVILTRPFLHVGLDYFGPITIKEGSGQTDKAYGCIVTCTTTRMVHIEVVKNNNTVTFLNALRRFIARRGVPRTITSDNAPTFLLGKEILSETVENFEHDEDTARFIANQAIEWRTITPYAPWQGGFYERLIQSVKKSMYKTIGRRILDFETLSTLLTEVEASLNNRPLTYQNSELEEIPTIRPIDFVQKEICLTYPIHPRERDQVEDEDYLPPEEATQFRTKRDTQRALETSCQHADRFWQIWQNMYLTELREHHKTCIKQGRTTKTDPRVGQIVIIQDPHQPRNVWKLATISSLTKRTENDGLPREAEVTLPTGRKQRRPINHLIPLEMDAEEDDTKHLTSQKRREEQPMATNRYNLRPRQAKGAAARNVLAHSH